MKLCIFLPNWLGDLVMATPTLRAIRHHFGSQARIVGIMRPYLATVLDGTKWLDEQWYFHPQAKDPQMRHWALVRRLRRERFDMAVLLPNSLRQAMLAWLGGVKERIGYARNGRGPLLTGRLFPPRSEGRRVECPVVSYYLALAEVIGCPPESPRLELAVTEQERQSADRVWSRLGLRDDGRVVVFNSGSSNGEARNWPGEHFAELAQRIASDWNHDVLIVCGPKERQAAAAMARRAAHPRVFSMVDQPLDLGTSKACIARTRLMVSTDSGPRHMAAALGKPVVTMRGPTVPIWSANPTVEANDLRLELDCIACRQPVCPLGHHRCMRELTVDMVYREVSRLLGEPIRRAA